MKTIVIYATVRANLEPGTHGYNLSPVDPDPGVPLSKRTTGSGYAIPVPCQVPEDWTIGETMWGEEMLWDHQTTAQALEWGDTDGVLSAWPAMMGYLPHKDRQHFKAARLSDIQALVSLP